VVEPGTLLRRRDPVSGDSDSPRDSAVGLCQRRPYLTVLRRVNGRGDTRRNIWRT